MPVASSEDYASWLPAARLLALEAGRTIMVFYREGTPVETKADSTPVTEADRAADGLIVTGLQAATPDIPVISEESTSAGPPPAGGRFWLVDPLDGTREFIARTGEFTVNIALIEDGRPVLGVLHAPVQGETYVADGLGQAVRIVGDGRPQAIRARPVPARGPAVIASRSHRDAETDAYIAGLGTCADRERGERPQVRPAGAGRSRHIPPLRPHHGVGHRRRPRNPLRRRRPCPRPERSRAELWQGGVRESALRRLRRGLGT